VVSAACDPVFRTLAHEPSAYRAAVDELLARPFAEDTLKADIERHAAFIESAVAADPVGPGLDDWRAAVTDLQQSLPLLRFRLERLRDGLPNTPFELPVAEVSDFEATDAAAIALGAVPLCNPRSTVSASLNAVEPLAGQRDLRLDFVYRNPSDPPQNPWDQWIYFPLRLSEAPRVLSTLSGLRLLLRADSPRTLRIDLDSDVYQASQEGIKFGWDIPVEATPRQVELRFADAKLPPWARLTSDSLERVLERVEAIAFHPYCAGRDAAGFLPKGGSDPGFLEIDQLEFF
jgi:hypothetical protein